MARAIGSTGATSLIRHQPSSLPVVAGEAFRQCCRVRGNCRTLPYHRGIQELLIGWLSELLNEIEPVIRHLLQGSSELRMGVQRELVANLAAVELTGAKRFLREAFETALCLR